MHEQCSNMYLGDIYLSANGYGQDSLPADGRILDISGHTAIFSLLSNNFGGDGITTFALPDLRPFTPKGLQYSICVEGIYPTKL
jgi:microcystin-dependent protein